MYSLQELNDFQIYEASVDENGLVYDTSDPQSA